MSNNTALLSLIIFFFVSINIQAESALHINKAWIPEAPPGARVMAGYMEINNPTDKNIEIIAISSPDFARIEMHLSKEVNGTAKMLPQKTLNIPAGKSLSLASGGYHLMLIKPKKRLVNGQKAQLNFSFNNAKNLSLNISVKKATSHRNTMKCAAGKCGAGK